MTHTRKNVENTCIRTLETAPGSLDRPGPSRLDRFARNEDGSFIIFGLFMFVLLLLACGMGLDMMRLETARVKLQTTVDRAALAAANLNQELPPQDVVADYFEKAGIGEFLSGVTVTEVSAFATCRSTPRWICRCIS